MKTNYIYSATRAKVLENELLSETQLELLLSSKSVPEMFKVLQDTYLASYLSKHEETDLSKVLEQSVTDTKVLLQSIAPEPNLLEILWIKYDFYNLRTVIKGLRAGLSDSDIVSECFSAGLYDPETVLARFRDDKLRGLDPRLANAADEAKTFNEVSDIDITLNIHFFRAVKAIADAEKNTFARAYVTLLIDLYNLVTGLRQNTLKRDNSTIKDAFVPGGSFSKKDFAAEQSILALFKRLGGERVWKEALAEYQKTGSISLIEKTAEEYKMEFLKTQSFILPFSPAPLFAYFTARKNNAQTIRAIAVGKQSGLSEQEIRANLRKLY